jgi:hypothetical protein
VARGIDKAAQPFAANQCAHPPERLESPGATAIRAGHSGEDTRRSIA